MHCQRYVGRYFVIYLFIFQFYAISPLLQDTQKKSSEKKKPQKNNRSFIPPSRNRTYNRRAYSHYEVLRHFSTIVIYFLSDVDKIFELSDRVLLGVNGDAGEMTQYTQYILKNLQLYKMKNKYDLDPAAVVHFSRTNLTDTIRSGVSKYRTIKTKKYHVCLCDAVVQHVINAITGSIPTILQGEMSQLSLLPCSGSKGWRQRRVPLLNTRFLKIQ